MEETEAAAVTSHQARLYGLALALVVFFLGWAVVAAHPWATQAADPRLMTLGKREAQLRREAQAVRVVHKHVFEARLMRAPPVRDGEGPRRQGLGFPRCDEAPGDEQLRQRRVDGRRAWERQRRRVEVRVP